MACAEEKRELCENAGELMMIELGKDNDINQQLVICTGCIEIYKDDNAAAAKGWQKLTENICSTTPAVQVFSYRKLKKLEGMSWAQDALDSIYLDEDTDLWAEPLATFSLSDLNHEDRNGNILENGDNVTLTQDLDVKGSSITAKRGVSVPRIKLVHYNEDQIEGKVDGQTIAILTK